MATERTYRLPSAAVGLRWHRSAFVTGVAALQAAKLLVAFAAARWLTPEEFAAWNKLLLLVQYSTYAQLGATMGINRDYAILVARGEEQLARRRAGAALAIVVTSTAVFSAAGVWFFDLADWWLYAAYVALPVLTGVVLLNQGILRSLRRFRRVGVLLTIEAAGWTALVLPFLAWRGSAAFVAVIDLVLVATLVPYLRLTRSAVARFARTHLVAAVASGLPIAAAGITYTVRQTGDLLVALHRFDDRFFAGLAVATIFVRALAVVPTLTNLMWLPEFGAAFGRGGERSLLERARGVMRRYVPLVAASVGVLSVAAFVACSTIFERYEEVRWLVTLKVAAEGTTLLVVVLTMYLSTVRRTRVMVLANLVAMVPFAIVLVLADATQARLGMAVAASAVLYVGIVLAGFARLTRDVTAST